MLGRGLRQSCQPAIAATLQISIRCKLRFGDGAHRRVDEEYAAEEASAARLIFECYSAKEPAQAAGETTV